MPLSHTGDIGMDRLGEIDGMLLDAPPRIFLDRHSTIPLIALRTSPKFKAQNSSLAKTAQLTIVHLETGITQVVKFQKSPDIEDPNPPSPGWINEWVEEELKSFVNLGPEIGKYLLRLLDGPEASNSRVIQIFPEPNSENSQETKEKLHHLRIGSSGMLMDFIERRIFYEAFVAIVAAIVGFAFGWLYIIVRILKRRSSVVVRQA